MDEIDDDMIWMIFGWNWWYNWWYLVIDIDDDINLDDILGWNLMKFGWNLVWNWWYLMIYTCVVICVCIYTGGYSDSYILMIFGWNLMIFGWYLDDIWMKFGMKLMIYTRV